MDKTINEEVLIDLSELFKVFGDSTRIKIIYTLMNKKLCVYDIAKSINCSQSAVSHQLRILKQAKLVSYNKIGKQIYYQISDNHVEEIFKKGWEHICE